MSKLPMPDLSQLNLDTEQLNIAIKQLEKAYFAIQMAWQTDKITHFICTALSPLPVEGDLRPYMQDQCKLGKSCHTLRNVLTEWCFAACGKHDMQSYYKALHKGVLETAKLHAWRLAVMDYMLAEFKQRRTLQQTPSAPAGSVVSLTPQQPTLL